MGTVPSEIYLVHTTLNQLSMGAEYEYVLRSVIGKSYLKGARFSTPVSETVETKAIGRGSTPLTKRADSFLQETLKLVMSRWAGRAKITFYPPLQCQLLSILSFRLPTIFSRHQCSRSSDRKTMCCLVGR